MDLGVGLPTAGALASPSAIVRVAQEAERLGYAAVWTFERLLRPIADVILPVAMSRSRPRSSTGASTNRWSRSAMWPR